jgi:hypothetical protein
LDEVILYVIGHPAWLQKARQGRSTTAKYFQFGFGSGQTIIKFPAIANAKPFAHQTSNILNRK